MSKLNDKFIPKPLAATPLNATQQDSRTISVLANKALFSIVSKCKDSCNEGKQKRTTSEALIHLVLRIADAALHVLQTRKLVVDLDHMHLQQFLHGCFSDASPARCNHSHLSPFVVALDLFLERQTEKPQSDETQQHKIQEH